MAGGDDPVEVVRAAFVAFVGGDVEGLRARVDADLEWTYLDPSQADPQPATCHGRGNLEAGIGRWASMGLATEIEEMAQRGERVLVVLHTPGLDTFRERNADDRNFHVATVEDGHVVALRAFRDRAEAERFLVSGTT